METIEARGEGFLKLVRDSELPGRRPLLEQMCDATKFRIYAARYAFEDVHALPHSTGGEMSNPVHEQHRSEWQGD